MMLFVPEKRFYYDENRYLNYRVLGTGMRNIVFLHGFGASGRTWDDLLPHLSADNNRFILFDLIGYGFSSRTGITDYSMEANARAIADFIRREEIKRFVLAGHSFGGGIALLTAIRMLDKYEAPPEALVLIDAAAYKTRFPFFVSFLRAPLLGGLLLALTTSAFQARYTLKKLYFQKMCVTEKRVERYARFMSLPGHRRTMIETAKQIVPSAFREYIDRYRDLDMPALVLWGRHDPAISLSCGRKLSEELPRGTLSVIEDSGHNPQEERPERTAEAINRFLMQ